MSLPMMTATGRVTATPELKALHGGPKVCHVRIACVERRRDLETGQWFDSATTYLDVNLHGNLAAATAATLATGDLVVATGHLTQRDREGCLYYALRAESPGRIPNRSEAA